MTSAPIFVENIIHQRKVVLFSKSYCPECKRVKEILKQYRDLDYEGITIIEIEKRSDSSEVEDYLHYLTNNNRRKAPLLFIKGRYLGGYEDILRLDAERKIGNIISQGLVDDDSTTPMMEEVVVTFAKVDRTEMVVRFDKELRMVPRLENIEDEKDCYLGDHEGIWFDPWLPLSEPRGSPFPERHTHLEETTSSLHTMRRDSMSVTNSSTVAGHPQ